MELKDFISQTIEQISLGINEAQAKCEQYGVIVNPRVTIGRDGDFYLPKKTDQVAMERRVQLLDLDIAVTITESAESNIGGKIGVSFIGLGANTKEDARTSNVNRVKFSLPICLPTTN